MMRSTAARSSRRSSADCWSAATPGSATGASTMTAAVPRKVRRETSSDMPGTIQERRGKRKKEKGQGRREKGEGRREKGEGRRQKAEGRRQKAEGRRQERTRSELSNQIFGREACGGGGQDQR